MATPPSSASLWVDVSGSVFEPKLKMICLFAAVWKFWTKCAADRELQYEAKKKSLFIACCVYLSDSSIRLRALSHM